MEETRPDGDLMDFEAGLVSANRILTRWEDPVDALANGADDGKRSAIVIRIDALIAVAERLRRAFAPAISGEERHNSTTETEGDAS